MSLSYRPEIDGLRAVAVLSVVIYHAEFALTKGQAILLSGGFIGVDIFFVISGFLITSLLIKDLNREGLNLFDFYERRARRILPALFTVMLACLPFAWMWFMPNAFKAFAGSGLSAIFFGSNIWFWQEVSYMADAGTLKPLLHTWSLAVEEQFYLIFPLLLWAVWRAPKRWHFSILCGVGLFSLIWAIYRAEIYSSANFYLLPSRMWELLAGSALAVWQVNRADTKSNIAQTLFSVFGLILIFSALCLMDAETPHPSWPTIAPVLGTVFLIAFTHANTPLGRILGCAPLRYIGRLSYSLYLWHFPIFAFARIKGFDLSVWDKIGLILLAFVLSILSYHFIEQVFRNRKQVSFKAFVLTMLSALTLLIGFNSYVLTSGGAPKRLGSLEAIYAKADRVWTRQDGAYCHSGGVARRGPERVSDSCYFESSVSGNDIGKDIILIGDSHAGSLSATLKEYAQKQNRGFMQITRAGCPHIYGTQIIKNGQVDSVCQERSQDLDRFLKNHPPATLIYSARLPLYLSGELYKNEDGQIERGRTDLSGPKLELDPLIPDPKIGYAKTTEDAVTQTLQSWLDAGHDLILIYPVPEQGFKPLDKLTERLKSMPDRQKITALNRLKLTTDYAHFKSRIRQAEAVLDTIKDSDALIRIRPETAFCNTDLGHCYINEGLNIYYYEDNHVSPLGASMILNPFTQTSPNARVNDPNEKP